MTTKTRFCLFSFMVLLWSQSALAQNTWDSDGDGIDDNFDNCTLVFNPEQHDSDHDFKGNMCDADFNNDQVINTIDLGILRDNFFTDNALTDINADGITNVADLGLLKAMYFEVPGPTGADPNQPPCTCYFSGDCPGGTFCNYGPGNFSTEDICVWRDVKPDGTVGAGCSRESDLTTGAWTPDICDGVCTASEEGSSIGFENQALVAQTIAVWGEAMINPSAAGGGPVDPVLAAQATSFAFNVDDTALVIGRQTADALAMSAGEPFHNYFCHFEGHPEDKNPPVVDLAGDTCRITAGQLTVQALVSELQTPGTAPAIMKNIPNACPNWQQMFGTQCVAGPGALNCAIQFIQAQAHFLRTPSVQTAAAEDAVDMLLGKALR